MSEPVQLKVTKLGVQSSLSAGSKGIDVKLSTIKYSKSRFASVINDNRVNLDNVVFESAIASGGVSLSGDTLRLFSLLDSPTDIEVSSMGVYTETGVLFAIASVETGSLFKIPSRISFVVSFGMTLSPIILANVKVVTDQNAAIAMALIAAHELHPDPHPQYAKKTLVNSEVSRLEDKLDSLLGITELFFPPLLQAEYEGGSDNTFDREYGAIYSLADNTIAFLCCPEGSHEAWDISREITKIITKVYNRSGTNRIVYSGRTNFIAIDVSRILVKRGYKTVFDQLDNEIKTGVIDAGKKTSVVKSASEALNYNSADVVVLMTPEGGHEAWSIVRTAGEIIFDIFSRSGTGRGGYNGRVNYMLMRKKNVPTNLKKYPNVLIAGIGNGGLFTIPVPAGFDFTNPAYMPFITPESGHEAWYINRTAIGFEVYIFHRSGTSRVGYSGQTSWAVFVMEQPFERDVYFVGIHSIQVAAGKKVQIALYAPGGGGGGSVYSPSVPPDGTDAGNTTLVFGAMTLIAGGGKHGGGGVWGNGSSFSNGTAGAGGVNSISELAQGFILKHNADGYQPAIGSRWERQEGGAATSLNSGVEGYNNAGGMGAIGIGDEQWSFGGGGGSGGCLIVEYENTTEATVTLSLNVGQNGKGWKTSGIHGDDGGDGFAVVTKLN